MCSALRSSTEKIEENLSRFCELLQEMEASLSGRRNNGRLVSEVILPDRSRFLLRQLIAGQDTYIEKAHCFMLAEFGPEAETKDWFRHAIEKKVNTVFVVFNEDEKVVGLSNSQYLILKGNAQGSTIYQYKSI